MIQIFPLFSSSLIIINTDLDTSQLQNDNIKFKETQSGGGTEISKDIRILKKYPKLENSILNEFKTVAKESFKYTNDFVITTSWITKAKYRTYSQFHLHKNSFYSGIYYYGKYFEDSGGLEFENPLWEYNDFYVHPKQYSFSTATSYSFTPTSNLLVFFPSYLKHRITEHKHRSDRYSLAFNIIPIGEYGIGDSTYNTSWT
tara:strand:+ start:87 stop:689 length:603 start_codon:yes stop_codon:yes gene_type:complete